VYILDVNLEPAIAPEYALAKAARAAGWTYIELVNRILEHAIERYPHLRDPGQPGNGRQSAVIPELVLALESQQGELRCP